MTPIKVTDYQLIDHGIDGAQYFPGCGVAFTDYDHCATGNGDTFQEALDDCLESIAQDHVDVDDLNARLLADHGRTEWETLKSESAIENARKANGHLSDEEWDEELSEMDVYYYVSVRYCLPKSAEVNA